MDGLIEEHVRTLRGALSRWGQDLQMDKAQEECAELVVALAQYRAGRVDAESVAKEVVDTLVVAYQMWLLMQAEGVDMEGLLCSVMQGLKSRVEAPR